MNQYVSQEEIDQRLKAIAVEISVDNLDNCIKTLQTIKRILEKGAEK